MKTIEETYRERLKLLVKEYKTQAALARALEKSPAQLSQWINASKDSVTGKPRAMGSKMAREIEERLGKPTGWMDQPVGDNEISSTEQLIERGKGHMRLWSKNDPLPEDEFVQVPFYKEVAFKAGNGCCEMEDYNGYTLGFSKATLFRSGINSKDVVCVSVSGNSMEPVLPEGTTIGLDLNRKAIKDGEIYAFKHDDLFRVKVLYRLPGQKIRLKSYNDMEYPEEIVEEDQIEIIGLVFWWSVLR